MNRLLRSLFVAGALAGALSACATYDYGYGYAQPYSYGYAAPYAYDYDYPYYGYAPGYYVGPPAVGFDFRYRDRDHRDRGHFDRDHRGAWSGDHRMSSNWRPDRRASSNRCLRQSATATSVNSATQQGGMRAMQARDRSVTAPRGSRIAPAPPDRQRAQAAPRPQRPEVHAEQRE